MSPDEALAVAREMVADRRVLTLEGGRMTTLAVRAQEEAIERRSGLLASPPAGMSASTRGRARAGRSRSASPHPSPASRNRPCAP